MAEQQTAVDFFIEHAGFSFDPKVETEEQGKRRCAEALAAAEEWAQEVGVRFDWREDFEVDHQKEFDCYADGGPETCEWVAAMLNGELVASLGCVDDATPEYRRVIEAELALEAKEA